MAVEKMTFRLRRKFGSILAGGALAVGCASPDGPPIQASPGTTYQLSEHQAVYETPDVSLSGRACGFAPRGGVSVPIITEQRLTGDIGVGEFTMGEISAESLDQLVPDNECPNSGWVIKPES